MRSTHGLLALLLVLAALVSIPGCSDGDGGMLDASHGNVRVFVTAEGGALAAVENASFDTAAAGEGAEGAIPGVLAWDDEDEDDDDDLPPVAEAHVTLSSLLARNLGGELVNLALDLPVTFDVIELMDAGHVELPLGTLPPGTYDQIVAVIGQVELVREDGSIETLTPPGGGWTRIMDVTPFEVLDGAITTIELSFRPWSSISEHGGQLHFFPDLTCQSHP